VTEEVLTNRTPEAHAKVLEDFRSYAGGKAGQFVPPRADKMMVAMPGGNGGAEWGGPATDPKGVLYVNENETPRLLGLTLARTPASPGERVYLQRCSSCHGADRTGAPPEIPSLVDVNRRLTDTQIHDLIDQGKGRMPSFPDLNPQQVTALLGYLRAPSLPRSDGSSPIASANDADVRQPPSSSRYNSSKPFFNDPDGFPATVPPWGTLNAIDMNTGKYLWRVPLGYYPELLAKGLKDTGTLNYGGPVVTAGGIVFIAATAYDNKIRAFNSSSGKMLWEGDLPMAGLATPATYMVNGQPYVVIARGGEGGPQFRGPRGGVYVAFTLP